MVSSGMCECGMLEVAPALWELVPVPSLSLLLQMSASVKWDPGELFCLVWNSPDISGYVSGFWGFFGFTIIKEITNYGFLPSAVSFIGWIFYTQIFGLNNCHILFYLISGANIYNTYKQNKSGISGKISRAIVQSFWKSSRNQLQSSWSYAINKFVGKNVTRPYFNIYYCL